jgi:hypothetical protein
MNDLQTGRLLLRRWKESDREPFAVSMAVAANLPSRRVMEKVGMTYEGEFEHPRLPEGHPLRRHVIYRCAMAGAGGPPRGN